MQIVAGSILCITTTTEVDQMVWPNISILLIITQFKVAVVNQYLQALAFLFVAIYTVIAVGKSCFPLLPSHTLQQFLSYLLRKAKVQNSSPHKKPDSNETTYASFPSTSISPHTKQNMNITWTSKAVLQWCELLLRNDDIHRRV